MEMNEAEMKAELERLRAENAQLKTKEKGGITLKVSDKALCRSMEWGAFPSLFTKSSGFVSLPVPPRLKNLSAKTI
jgi:hypothetical protein